jgi:hypothetical protein
MTTTADTLADAIQRARSSPGVELINGDIATYRDGGAPNDGAAAGAAAGGADVVLVLGTLIRMVSPSLRLMSSDGPYSSVAAGLLCSASAALKSKASLRSWNPRPMNAWRPAIMRVDVDGGVRWSDERNRRGM